MRETEATEDELRTQGGPKGLRGRKSRNSGRGRFGRHYLVFLVFARQGAGLGGLQNFFLFQTFNFVWGA